jgi:HSP20 family molecular chaperone IbpA
MAEACGLGLQTEFKVASHKDFDAMTRVSMLSSPLLLGFEEIERLIDRAGKAGHDGYPPYNIERIARLDGAQPQAELLRISLAVAGFTREQLEITVEDSQLVVRGRQQDHKSRDFLYRGIATRQFQRTFVLADGIEVRAADLSNGLLSIDLVRVEPERLVRRIEIGAGQGGHNRDRLVVDQRAVDQRKGPETGPKPNQAGNVQERKTKG